MGSFALHQPWVDGSTGRLASRNGQPAAWQRSAVMPTRVTPRRGTLNVTATATSERDSARSGTVTSTSTSVVTNQVPSPAVMTAGSAGARQAAKASSQPSPLSSVDRLVHQEMSLRTVDWGQEMYWEWDYNSQICYRQVRAAAGVCNIPRATSRGRARVSRGASAPLMSGPASCGLHWQANRKAMGLQIENIPMSWVLTKTWTSVRTCERAALHEVPFLLPISKHTHVHGKCMSAERVSNSNSTHTCTHCPCAYTLHLHLAVQVGESGPPVLMVHGFGVGGYHFHKNWEASAWAATPLQAPVSANAYAKRTVA